MSFLKFVLYGVSPSSSAEGGTRIPTGFPPHHQEAVVCTGFAVRADYQ